MSILDFLVIVLELIFYSLFRKKVIMQKDLLIFGILPVFIALYFLMSIGTGRRKDSPDKYLINDSSMEYPKYIGVLLGGIVIIILAFIYYS